MPFESKLEANFIFFGSCGHNCIDDKFKLNPRKNELNFIIKQEIVEKMPNN